VGKQSVFISYSRQDREIVAPLVELLRATGQGIFRDMDCIDPGKRWRVVLTDAIDSCRTMILFWCCHSARSTEVEKEYRQAIQQNKVIVPVLMDAVRLTGELSEFQAIDLRTIIGEHKERIVEVPIVARGMQSNKLPTVHEIHVEVPEPYRLRSAAITILDGMERLWAAKE
jgi:hypothetical protein